MRILQVVHNALGRTRGGTERYTAELAAALAARHRVRILTTDVGEAGGVREGSTGDVPIRALLQPPSRSFTERWRTQRALERRFARDLAEDPVDVIHFQHVIDASPGLLAVAAGKRVPFLVSLHDYWWLCPRLHLLRRDGSVCTSGPVGGLACLRHCSPARDGRTGPPSPPGPRRPRDLAFVVRAIRHRRALARVPRFLAPSADARARYARLGLPAERIEVVPLGLPPAPVQLRMTPTAPVRFGFVGLLSYAKGVDELIEVFGAVDPRLATLTLHGPIATEEETALRARLAAAPAVRWEGPFGEGGLDTALRAMDVLVVPSRAPETWSRVAHEAWQRSTPILARRAGALSEADGRGGAVFDDRTSLRQAIDRLSDPAEVDRLRRTIPMVLSIQQHARAVEDQYRGIGARG